MTKTLEHAILLRKHGNYKQSNELLVKIVKEYPNDASINYQCAWSYDLLGEEAKAAPFYEKAIQLGLPSKEMEGAVLGLGSTYRTLGEYEKSKTVLQKGMNIFPNNQAIQVFYAMTLYNLNKHHQAMEILLTCLLDTTTDHDILSYKKAIHFYSNKLDNIWK
ncbi:MAG TPA: tetratricopeptide repeat protein [Virgibacillus sp.]|nr:tetratricopeptide repeat protein [Virgibacillus sp.]